MTSNNFAKPKYQLNIKLTTDDPSYVAFYNNFTTHHLGDSGIDLVFNNNLQVQPFAVGTLDFNIRCELIDLESNCYSSYFLVPRSSLANTHFQLANSIGIIDAGYRGNIKAKVRNFNQSEQVFPLGSYFQIVAPDLKPTMVNIVQEQSETTRNDGGFGSTNN